MILNVLAVGDVVGDGGLDYLGQHLRALKKLKNIHFTVVNGENASGVGILPRQARAIFDAGADVVTLGNHTWNRIPSAWQSPPNGTTASRSRTFWRTTAIPCVRPTIPAGSPAAAGACTTARRGCASGCST